MGGFGGRKEEKNSVTISLTQKIRMSNKINEPFIKVSDPKNECNEDHILSALILTPAA